MKSNFQKSPNIDKLVFYDDQVFDQLIKKRLATKSLANTTI
ncbi:30649_t:CDS:2, partial [Gigaspora margarita]